ncbi:MAG: tRNA (adenosine(37)-N6)-dimethylallyltransferase MiaA [Alphaproteobacteria bacterium]
MRAVEQEIGARGAKDGALIVVAGPTASGKSALALTLAEALDGVVINADSVQLYRELRILSARPGPDEEARAPHRLYGVLPAGEACSAGRWRALAEGEIERCWREGRLPIVAGGTGLYLRALLKGLAPVPSIPEAVRRRARTLYAELGGPAFRAELARRDPEMAARLVAGDRQRLMRAFEVMEATGRSLADWQRETPEGIRAGLHVLLLDPPRAALYDACERRVERMIAEGALDELEALAGLELDPGLPAMKAVGVRELLAYLRGESALERAIAEAKKATRRYAKRQITWFRHQMLEVDVVSDGYEAGAAERVVRRIEGALLTANS